MHNHFTKFLSDPLNLSLFIVIVCCGLYLIYIQLVDIFEKSKININDAIYLINNDNARILDFRSHADFCLGHINGSINIIFENFIKEKKVYEILSNTTIIVIAPSNNKAKSIIKILQELGYAKSYFVEDGILAWTNLNLPIIKSKNL